MKLISLLSETAGAEGMVGGQLLDIQGEKKTLTLEELEQIHLHKTGCLLRFSVLAGAILGGATEQQRAILEKYIYHLGLAFQIKDDILDIEGTTEELGKTAGKDAASEKNTYPALLTLEGAKEKLQDHYLQAIEVLSELEVDTSLLETFASYITYRSK